MGDASRDTGWLFPGGNPGRHLATENIRAQLVAIGIKPYENRKATLFQLAGDIPTPVLAELIGITNDNAADWADSPPATGPATSPNEPADRAPSCPDVAEPARRHTGKSS